LGLKNKPKKLPELQMSASVGQLYLMSCYNKYFMKQKSLISQILLTYGDFNNATRKINAKNTLLTSLKNNVTPIVNENDTVSVEEIKFGDNDKLAGLVSVLVKADLLILLSSPNGFYDDKQNRVKYISKLDKKIMSYVSDDLDLSSNLSSNLSTGGMTSKLQAIKLVTNAKIPAVIASGLISNVIKNLFNNDDIGTQFLV